MPVTSVRDLCNALEKASLLVLPTKNHLRVTTRGGIIVGTLPQSPSDSRTLLNCRADIARRIGQIQSSARDKARTSDLPTGTR